ncbi:MAG: hypothetical protein WBG19_03705 [Thermoplasmata archaeon]
MAINNRYSVVIRPAKTNAGQDLGAFHDPFDPHKIWVRLLPAIGFTLIDKGQIWEAHNVVEIPPSPSSPYGSISFEGLFNVGAGMYLRGSLLASDEQLQLVGTVNDLGKPGFKGTFKATPEIHEKKLVTVHPAGTNLGQGWPARWARRASCK